MIEILISNWIYIYLVGVVLVIGVYTYNTKGECKKMKRVTLGNIADCTMLAVFSWASVILVSAIYLTETTLWYKMHNVKVVSWGSGNRVRDWLKMIPNWKAPKPLKSDGPAECEAIEWYEEEEEPGSARSKRRKKDRTNRGKNRK